MISNLVHSHASNAHKEMLLMVLLPVLHLASELTDVEVCQLCLNLCGYHHCAKPAALNFRGKCAVCWLRMHCCLVHVLVCM